MSGTVYLAGPVTGLTLERARAWRRRAADALARLGVETFDPTADLPDLAGRIGPAPIADLDDADLVDRCRRGIEASAAVLALLAGRSTSVGTLVELGWADAFGVPVVAVLRPPSPYDHPFVRRIARATFPTLPPALATVALLARNRC